MGQIGGDNRCCMGFDPQRQFLGILAVLMAVWIQVKMMVQVSPPSWREIQSDVETCAGVWRVVVGCGCFERMSDLSILRQLFVDGDR